jgi:thiamine-monophosphate kinase
MPLGEFALIARFFKRPAPSSGAVALGIGDDCALLQTPPGMQLAVSSDMLVCGRHFFSDVNPRSLGHKALAVNLSDLAACGARPVAFTLALALPEANETWLQPFSEGLLALADAHGCVLMGGDTTQGPLNICITVFGEVPQGQALLRSGAQAGDDIWVSGTLGDARLALEHLRGTLQLPAEVFLRAQSRMDRPTPRVALGQALRGIASAAIDVSDGLLGDLGHILQQSGVGATVDANVASFLIAARALPTVATGQLSYEMPEDLAIMCALSGGDDYELVFTAAPSQRAAVAQVGAMSQTAVTRIGRIEAAPGLRVVDARGEALAQSFASFDHFLSASDA